MKKNLVIDCQIFQTASWDRGMGKYSYSLLKYILEDPEITSMYNFGLVFCSGLSVPGEVKAMIDRAAVRATIEVHKFDLDVPDTDRAHHSIEKTKIANKQLLTRYFRNKSNNRYDFLILALYLDEVCPVFPETKGQKLLVYYDAIPYLYFERYNQFAGFFDNFYFRHTATMYEATKLLTISGTVANDLRIVFGMPEEKIFNISGAAIKRQHGKTTVPRLDLQPDEYILMPTGQELRKNNTRAVEGFTRFSDKTGSNMKLVVTSHFTDEEKAKLNALNPNILFTGNIPENEINWLFENCRCLLFPSEYEGLGLPVLEAIDSEKQIACSNISAFREISRSAFVYFDPLDIESIACALERIYDGNVPDISKEFKTIRKEYRWENSIVLLKKALSAPIIRQINRKKIAILCPDPTGFSAIGKVIIESHAWYSEYFDITYYFDRGPNHRMLRPNPLVALAPCLEAKDFSSADYEKYDGVVYHIGNSEYHLNTIAAALALPGYVILHDTFLDGAFQNLINEGYISKQRYDYEKQLDLLLEQNDELRSSCLTSIVNNSHVVVGHSKYAHEVVAARTFNASAAKSARLNLPVAIPMFSEIIREQGDKLVISFAGIIADIKGLGTVGDIATANRYKECAIHVFGFSAIEPDQVEALKTLPHVSIKTNPSDFVFQNLMASSDVVLNVRLAYRGETSLTTLEAMRYGVIVLVRDFGWYSELPDDAVVKVDEPRNVLQKLSDLLSKPERIQKISHEAIKYIKENHSHKDYARGLYELINPPEVDDF